jgi:hypothetical protein
MAAAAPRAKRPAEAALELPEPKHACRLTGYLGSELGSERFSDVVVVLASHRPAAAAPNPPSCSIDAGPAAAAQEEGAVAVEAAVEGGAVAVEEGAVAVEEGAAGSMAGGRRMHAHALVLGLSPVWRAQLGDDDSFRPLPREGARKARGHPGEGGGHPGDAACKACPRARPDAKALPLPHPPLHPLPHSTGTAQ